jgi:hypothetical protein
MAKVNWNVEWRESSYHRGLENGAGNQGKRARLGYVGVAVLAYYLHGPHETLSIMRERKNLVPPLCLWFSSLRSDTRMSGVV